MYQVEAVVGLCACDGVQTEVELLQVRVVLETLQLFKALNVVVVSYSMVKVIMFN